MYWLYKITPQHFTPLEFIHTEFVCRMHHEMQAGTVFVKESLTIHFAMSKDPDKGNNKDGKYDTVSI